MKLDIVTQKVQVLPKQSLAGNSVVRSTGMPGHGSLEPDAGWIKDAGSDVATFASNVNKDLNMVINFKCKQCAKIFDCDVGKIGIDEKSMRPDFEKEIVCLHCGKRTMDEVLLTELGQTQLTEATLKM